MWTDTEGVAFARRLTLLAEVLAEPMSPTRIAGYRAALDDLTPDEVNAALNRATRACKFFPKPAELREFVESDQRMLRAEQQAAYRATVQAREQKLLETREADVTERERRQAELEAQSRPTPEEQAAAEARRVAAFEQFQAVMRETVAKMAIPEPRRIRRVK
jgi:hypothetical protein